MIVIAVNYLPIFFNLIKPFITKKKYLRSIDNFKEINYSTAIFQSGSILHPKSPLPDHCCGVTVS